jgi:hypothetical protein
MFTEKEEYIDPPKGKKKVIHNRKWVWVTDIKIKKSNAKEVVRVGRRRWAIENETFKTLKNTTDYNIEHCYGHGDKNLAINFALLCILAFLIDQIQEIVSTIFKEVLLKVKTKKRMWKIMKSAMEWLKIDNWNMFHDILHDRYLVNSS